MKGRYLDAILAANNERRSVALATELASGRQLLLDHDRYGLAAGYALASILAGYLAIWVGTGLVRAVRAIA